MAAGFRRGDVLAICGPVGLSTWRLDNACLYLGGVCAPLAVTEGPISLRAMLANAEVRPARFRDTTCKAAAWVWNSVAA